MIGGMGYHRHHLPCRHRHDNEHPLRPSCHYVIVVELAYVDIVIITVVVIVLVCRSSTSWGLGVVAHERTN